MDSKVLWRFLRSSLQSFEHARTWCIEALRRTNTASGTIGSDNKPIEQSPPGYPQFSSLIGAHPAFSLSSRFSITRARLLLSKQERVSMLERRLEQLDLQEERPLFLGSFERDQNLARIQTLNELDGALADYGKWRRLSHVNLQRSDIVATTNALMKRSVEILQLPSASQKSISSLLNWVNNNGSISRKETKFLYRPDLCAIGNSNDGGLMWMESLVEWAFIWFNKCFSREPPSGLSRDQRVFIFTGRMLRITTHVCLTALIVLLLLIPMAIMRSTTSGALQTVCITVASVSFTVILSGPMNARPAEIFVASATYATFLVVFFAGSKMGSCG